jgi:hypothetical protein
MLASPGASGFLLVIQSGERPVARVLPLRHDAFESEFAGVLEDERAVPPRPGAR